MNAKEIAAALAKQPTAEQASDLQRACEPARQAIRARLAQIVPSHEHDQPPAYRKAIAEGPAAMRKIEDETDELRRELRYLDSLESACTDAIESALTDKAKRDIPRAVKKLPALADRLRDAITAIEAVVADTNAELAMISEFERLPDKRFPLTDAALADILALRNALWQPRLLSVPAHLPPDPESKEAAAFPKSWPLMFDLIGESDQTVRTRLPPTEHVHRPWDFSGDPVVRIRARRR